MRKLSEVKGEEALDVLAEIIDAVVAIVQDVQISKAYKSFGIRNVKTIKLMITRRKKELLSIMAAIDGKPYDEFVESFNLVTLPVMLVDTFNDPDVIALFQSQTQMESETESGSAMESTEGKEN